MQNQEQIKPGIYPGMSNEAYHAGPGISKSGLTLMLKSPLHYYERYLSGKGPAPQTPAMKLGTAIHTAVLEPGKFKYGVQTQKKTTKKGKEEFAELTAKYGDNILTPDEMAKVDGMAMAVHDHPVASALLAPGEGVAEESIYWIDEATGVLCKCRPDWRRFDGIIIDLKSADDATPEGFARAAYNFTYHLQPPFYSSGATAASGIDYQTFIFIVVESKPPHAVAIYTLDEESLILGNLEIARAISLYAECMESGQWPGYNQEINTIQLPRWAFK